MGYSCARKAMEVVKVWQNWCYKNFDSQNAYIHNNTRYFFEIGKENGDGAITGSIWRFMPDGIHVKKSGSFRIESDGTITRAPKALLSLTSVMNAT
jgi:hypothetical protein